MMADLATDTADVLGRMLRRLPPSLWDTSPASATLQRDIFRAVSTELALWLENRAIAADMTLLLRAQGRDLDSLLADYGLKRYLQVPDDYARIIGQHILFHPKGTLSSVQILADLLFYNSPHITLRTGRQHVHVLLASTEDVTVPYSYWGIVSQEGQWYAVTVDGEVPTISPAPPPGLNVAPGPHTLHWFTARDASNALWYVTIQGDTLAVSQTQPPGYGSAGPYAVLDGHGTRWLLQVDAGSQALVSIVDTGLPGFGYWRLTAIPTGTVYALWMEGEVPTIATTSPGG